MTISLGAALCTALLSGCDATAPGGASFFSNPRDEAGQGETVRLLRQAELGGAIRVSGPEGYCIDPATLDASRKSGFAVLASCNILSGGAAGAVVEPAIVTIAASPSGEGAPPAPDSLAEALGTTMLADRSTEEFTLAQMAAGGDTAFDGGDPRHWRAGFSLGGLSVGLALYAPKGSPLAGSAGAAFLETVRSRIRATNAQKTADAEIPPAGADPLAEGLRRLFTRRNLQ